MMARTGSASSTARGPLLDVGCGGGLFLGMMRERGLNGTRDDIDAAAGPVRDHQRDRPVRIRLRMRERGDERQCNEQRAGGEKCAKVHGVLFRYLKS